MESLPEKNINLKKIQILFSIQYRSLSFKANTLKSASRWLAIAQKCNIY